MKRVLSLVLPLILTICLGALAQTDTTPSPSSTNQATSPRSSSSTQSNDQTTSPAQANPGSSSTMEQSGTTASSSPSVEGCIVQRQADYYLQPETGQAIKLNSSQDLSQHLGHRVRVEGNMNQASSSGSPGSGTYGSGGSSAAANSTGGTSSNSADRSTTATQSAAVNNSANGPTQEMLVTGVDMISATCPAGMQNQNSPTSKPNNTPESPK